MRASGVIHGGTVRYPIWKLLTPGGIVATSTWVVGSVAYAVYVESFADYNRLSGFSTEQGGVLCTDGIAAAGR